MRSVGFGKVAKVILEQSDPGLPHFHRGCVRPKARHASQTPSHSRFSLDLLRPVRFEQLVFPPQSTRPYTHKCTRLKKVGETCSRLLSPNPAFAHDDGCLNGEHDDAVAMNPIRKMGLRHVDEFSPACTET